MKRTQGYVVGRSTLKGILAWVVRVMQEGHEADGKKLRVSSIQSGVQLSPGLDVDFFLQTSNGQTTACDVALRVVTETKQKGTIQMRRTLLSVAVMLLAILGLLGYLASQSKTFQDQILELRLESAISTLKGMTFAEMVSDDAIRSAIKGKWPGVRSGKVAVFNKYLCPVFGDSDAEAHERCYDALYASGGDGTSENYWYEKAGIPGKLAPRVAYFRQLMLDKARAELRNPQALWAFYQGKKPVAIGVFRSMGAEWQAEVRANLREIKNAFERFSDPAMRSAIEAHIAGERAWWNDGKIVDSNWEPMRQATDELARLNNDGRYGDVLFINRRFTEGGDALVQMYLRIVDDLLKAASAQ